jgi:hypothetical protein
MEKLFFISKAFLNPLSACWACHSFTGAQLPITFRLGLLSSHGNIAHHPTLSPAWRYPSQHWHWGLTLGRETQNAKLSKTLSEWKENIIKLGHPKTIFYKAYFKRTLNTQCQEMDS